MTNFLIAVMALVALVAGYFYVRKLLLISRMSKAVDLVKRGLFRRLKRKYWTEAESPESTLLADAVVAFVFSEESTAAHELRFRDANMERIEQAARRLSGDKDLCQVITQAVRVQSTLKYANLQYANPERGRKVATDQLDRIRNLDILVVGGESPLPDTFIPLAQAFSNYDSYHRRETPPSP